RKTRPSRYCACLTRKRKLMASPRQRQGHAGQSTRSRQVPPQLAVAEIADGRPVNPVLPRQACLALALRSAAADGSARNVAAGTRPATWRPACPPAGGDVLGDDW